MNTIEWQKEAESVIASAHIEDVRLAFYTRLTERYGIQNGVFSAGTTEVNFLTEPLENLKVSITDAQRLAALKYLADLQEQFSWARHFFVEHLNVLYRGPRPVTGFVDKLLRVALLSALSQSNLDPKKSRSKNPPLSVFVSESPARGCPMY